MQTMMEDRTRPIPPSAPDIALARAASRDLAVRYARVRSQSEIRVRFLENDQAEEVALPAVAVRLLMDILSQMAQGNAVTIIPVHAELTTQQAADFLNVSRPFVTKLLQKGEIPFRKIGTHRRLKFEDILSYKKKTEVEQKQALDDLAAEAQELGMGY